MRGLDGNNTGEKLRRNPLSRSAVTGSLSDNAIKNANFNEGGDEINMYLGLLKSYDTSVDPEITAFHTTNNGGVNFQFFFPAKGSESNINNHSIVTLLEYHGVKILFPGDNEPLSWNELLESQDFTDAIKGTQVLIAPHHGRESGYCTELFDVISPNLVVISDGKFCDTSATARYSTKAIGWNVKNSNGESKDKKCVTTRDNGVIKIKAGWNQQINKPYLEVVVDHF